MSQIIKSVAVVLTALSIAAAMSGNATEIPTEPETHVDESLNSAISVVKQTEGSDQGQANTQSQELGGAPSEPLRAE